MNLFKLVTLTYFWLNVISINAQTRENPLEIQPGDFNEYFEYLHNKSEENRTFTFVRTQFQQNLPRFEGYYILNPYKWHPIFNEKQYVYFEGTKEEQWSRYSVFSINRPMVSFAVPLYPNTKTEFQFLYKNWLILNGTHCLNITKIYEAGKDKGGQFVDVSPPPPALEIKDAIPEISGETQRQIERQCFSPKNYTCYFDMDNHELRVSNSDRIILHQFGISLIMVKKFVEQNVETYPEYMIKYDNKYYAFPKNLTTFNSSKSIKRYMIVPIFNKNDTFLMNQNPCVLPVKAGATPCPQPKDFIKTGTEKPKKNGSFYLKPMLFIWLLLLFFTLNNL